MICAPNILNKNIKIISIISNSLVYNYPKRPVTNLKSFKQIVNNPVANRKAPSHLFSINKLVYALNPIMPPAQSAFLISMFKNNHSFSIIIQKKNKIVKFKKE